MVDLGQDQVEEIGGSFCCVICTGFSELAKLIEQLVTPAAFPSLIVATVWSLNMAIQQQQIQLKKLVLCKAVEKDLDECSAGDKRKKELLGKNRSTFLLVMSCQVGWAVLYNSTLAAYWKMGAFTEVQ